MSGGEAQFHLALQTLCLAQKKEPWKRTPSYNTDEKSNYQYVIARNEAQHLCGL